MLTLRENQIGKGKDPIRDERGFGGSEGGSMGNIKSDSQVAITAENSSVLEGETWLEILISRAGIL